MTKKIDFQWILMPRILKFLKILSLLRCTFCWCSVCYLIPYSISTNNPSLILYGTCKVITSCVGYSWTSQIKWFTLWDFFLPVYTEYVILQNETNVNHEEFSLNSIILTHCLKSSLNETYFKISLIKILNFKNVQKA